tara:strand:+ start:1084 stop:1710 length:627 start_codon:yes stop_codon:yes gene_type:complete
MTQNFFNFNTIKNDEVIASHENEDVLNLLENLTCQLSYITGSSKSGKSTLANNYAKVHKAQIISDQSELLFSIDKKLYFIDQNLSKFNNELLFHFVQNIITHNYNLYIFSEFDHSQKPTGLADLDSRLSLFNKFNLNEPDDQLTINLLKKFLKINSISINETIISELPKYINRTYLGIHNCANDINRLLYTNNHNINLNLIKDFYNAI